MFFYLIKLLEEIDLVWLAAFIWIVFIIIWQMKDNKEIGLIAGAIGMVFGVYNLMGNIFVLGLIVIFFSIFVLYSCLGDYF